MVVPSFRHLLPLHYRAVETSPTPAAVAKLLRADALRKGLAAAKLEMLLNPWAYWVCA